MTRRTSFPNSEIAAFEQPRHENNKQRIDLLNGHVVVAGLPKSEDRYPKTYGARRSNCTERAMEIRPIFVRQLILSRPGSSPIVSINVDRERYRLNRGTSQPFQIRLEDANPQTTKPDPGAAYTENQIIAGGRCPEPLSLPSQCRCASL